MLDLSKDNLSIEDLNIGDFVRCHFYYAYNTNNKLIYTDPNKSFNAIFLGMEFYPGTNRFYFYAFIENKIELCYSFGGRIKDIALLC